MCAQRAGGGACHVAAVPQHSDPLGGPPDLVQVVGDEQDPRAACGRFAHQLEEALPFRLGQERCGLVEQQQPTACFREALDRPRDGQQGLLGGAQVPHGRPRVQVDAEPGKGVSRPPALLAPAQPQPPLGGELVQPQVLGHAERGNQPQVLVDEAHAQVAELARSQRQRNRSARHLEAAAVGRSVVTGQNPDQSRLAGAVLADQPVDLARLDRQTDVVQGALRAKGLGDVPGGERRSQSATRHSRL